LRENGVLEPLESRLLFAGPLTGDGNHDGFVTSADYGYDTNHDGKVNIDDYGDVDFNLGKTLADVTGPVGDPSNFLKYSGKVTLSTPGQVFENFILEGGSAYISVNASNITIRNGIVRNGSHTGNAISVESSDHRNVLIENVEVSGGAYTNAVKISYGTVRGCHFHNLHSDGIRIRYATVIEGNWIEDFGHGPESHGDAVQRYPTDGTGHVLRNNYLDARNANAAAFHLNDSTLSGNVFRGGNYTVQAERSSFIGNVWHDDSQYGPIITKEQAAWESNTWDDGTELPPQW
jgi:hypothetical protein